MGKKKSKGDKKAEFQHALISGTDEKVNKLLERYGVEGYRHGRTDRGSAGFRGADEVAEDLARAAANDYDTRRSLEAAAMSGKKKAKSILDDGFESYSDVSKAHDFLEKQAKKRGVKNFSSNTDYMGLTQSFVELDRRKHNEDINSRISDSIPEQEEPKDDIKQDMQAQTELSETAKNAIKFDQDMSYDPTAGVKDKGSGQFLDDYKFKQMKKNEQGELVTRGEGERTSAILGTGAGGLN